LRASEVLGGLRSRKEKTTTTPPTTTPPLFNEVLKNLIFFHLPIKKIGFITLIMSKSYILIAYLWLIL
jgi:hypothetical protein